MVKDKGFIVGLSVKYYGLRGTVREGATQGQFEERVKHNRKMQGSTCPGAVSPAALALRR
jgi:hypothetical protein